MTEIADKGPRQQHHLRKSPSSPSFRSPAAFPSPASSSSLAPPPDALRPTSRAHSAASPIAAAGASGEGDVLGRILGWREDVGSGTGSGSSAAGEASRSGGRRREGRSGRIRGLREVLAGGAKGAKGSKGNESDRSDLPEDREPPLSFTLTCLDARPILTGGSRSSRGARGERGACFACFFDWKRAPPVRDGEAAAFEAARAVWHRCSHPPSAYSRCGGSARGARRAPPYEGGLVERLDPHGYRGRPTPALSAPAVFLLPSIDRLSRPSGTSAANASHTLPGSARLRPLPPRPNLALFHVWPLVSASSISAPPLRLPRPPRQCELARVVPLERERRGRKRERHGHIARDCSRAPAGRRSALRHLGHDRRACGCCCCCAIAEASGT